MDREHQRNKHNKGHSEKTEFNERGLRREGTVLKDKHIRKDIPTLYNSWANDIYTQPLPYNHIWQQQTTREYTKTLHPSSFWVKEPGYTLGGCNRRGFSALLNNIRFKTLQLFVLNSKRLRGYTQWVHFFLQKSTRHQEDFFKIDHFKASRQKNPNRAISEFFLMSPSTKNQSNLKTRPSSSLFQIARGSGATPS